MLDLVIGIPSHNESDSIGNVVEAIESGLRKYFPELRAVIVNSDNNSSDRTKEIFLSTPTITKKVYLSTGKNSKGKGKNIFKILQFAKRNKAKVVILFDADVKSIKNKWIYLLLSPILHEGADLVTPLYRRNRMEGNTTNHLIYPYLFAVYNRKIQQPIGGEFALSKRLYEKVIAQKRWASTSLYGIDIMITALALKSKWKVKQQYLGRKMHKPSFPKQRLISGTELDTLFHIFLESKKKIYKSKKFDKTINLVDREIIYPRKEWIDASYVLTEKYLNKNKLELQKDFKQLNNDFFRHKNYKNFISSNVWVEVLAEAYRLLNKNNVNRLKEEMSELLLCRIYRFWFDIERMNLKQIDREIQKQSDDLRKILTSY